MIYRFLRPTNPPRAKCCLRDGCQSPRPPRPLTSDSALPHAAAAVPIHRSRIYHLHRWVKMTARLHTRASKCAPPRYHDRCWRLVYSQVVTWPGRNVKSCCWRWMKCCRARPGGMALQGWETGQKIMWKRGVLSRQPARPESANVLGDTVTALPTLPIRVKTEKPFPDIPVIATVCRVGFPREMPTTTSRRATPCAVAMLGTPPLV